jgi:hypothetical protein
MGGWVSRWVGRRTVKQWRCVLQLVDSVGGMMWARCEYESRLVAKSVFMSNLGKLAEGPLNHREDVAEAREQLHAV